MVRVALWVAFLVLWVLQAWANPLERCFEEQPGADSLLAETCRLWGAGAWMEELRDCRIQKVATKEVRPVLAEVPCWHFQLRHSHRVAPDNLRSQASRKAGMT